MKQWAWILLGLGMAAAIAWSIAGGPSEGPDVAAPPHAEIDDASRRALERVLDDAERRATEGPSAPETEPPPEPETPPRVPSGAQPR